MASRFELIEDDDSGAPDYRWMGPTFTCACGCDMFIIVTVFDRGTRLPGMYMTDGRCVQCNAFVKVPTEIDESPEGGLMIDQPEPAIPVKIDMTCPQCVSDENTVIIEEHEAPWEPAAKCLNAQCQPVLFHAVSEK